MPSGPKGEKRPADVFEVLRRCVVMTGARSAKHGASAASKRTAVRNARNRLNVAAPAAPCPADASHPLAEGHRIGT